MGQCYVDDADLRAGQRVCIVVSTQLKTVHLPRTDIGCSGDLGSLAHTHGDVCEHAELQPTHWREDNIAETGQLDAAHGMGGIGYSCYHQALGIPTDTAIEQSEL